MARAKYATHAKCRAPPAPRRPPGAVGPRSPAHLPARTRAGSARIIRPNCIRGDPRDMMNPIRPDVRHPSSAPRADRRSPARADRRPASRPPWFNSSAGPRSTGPRHPRRGRDQSYAFLHRRPATTDFMRLGRVGKPGVRGKRTSRLSRGDRTEGGEGLGFVVVDGEEAVELHDGQQVADDGLDVEEDDLAVAGVDASLEADEDGDARA